MTIPLSPEQWAAIQTGKVSPIRISDPSETQKFVLVKAEDYERVQGLQGLPAGRVHRMPEGFEAKFAGFIRSCREAEERSAEFVLVAQPWVLGDTYDEVIESLSRLADARLALHIASR